MRRSAGFYFEGLISVMCWGNSVFKSEGHDHYWVKPYGESPNGINKIPLDAEAFQPYGMPSSNHLYQLYKHQLVSVRTYHAGQVIKHLYLPLPNFWFAKNKVITYERMASIIQHGFNDLKTILFFMVLHFLYISW